jgi:hypothetical protein
LESELIRESLDDLVKAVTASGNALAGGGTNRALDSLYDIFMNIIVNPYVDQYRILDLGQYRSKFGKYPEATKLLLDIGF